MGLWRVRHQQFRDELDATNYPFGPDATFVSAAGVTLPAGLFEDAAIHPIGGTYGVYLSSVTVTRSHLTFTTGDAVTVAQASGTFVLLSGEIQIPLFDGYGRPAGILIADNDALNTIATWGEGTYAFTVDATPFVASVCIPTPEIGVSGILLDDGTFFSQGVFLVGGSGVTINTGTGSDPLTGLPVQTITVNAVGDPLYLRDACGDTANFTTPIFVTSLAVVGGSRSFVVTPDPYGNAMISVSNAEAHDTVLRVRTTSAGLVVETVGGSAG